jgi:hypothetical protein
MKKSFLVLGLCLVLIVSCATNNEGTKKARHGFGKALVGVAQLVLSPLQIAAGILRVLLQCPIICPLA